MNGLADYVEEGLPFAWDLCLENSADSYLCFRLALLHAVLNFFFLYWSPSTSLCTIFESISSNINEVLSINPSANVFVFEDFIVHRKDWLTDSPGELCYNFAKSFQNLKWYRWSTFLFEFQCVTLMGITFGFIFFTMALPP